MKKSQIVTIVVLMVLSLLTVVKADAEEYKIGVLIWYETKHDNEAFDGFKESVELSGLPCVLDLRRAYGDEGTSRRFLRRWKKEKADLILTIGTNAALVAKEEIKDIPVVFTAVTNPVISGIVESWEKPGRNVTGTSNWIKPDDKMADFKECIPHLKKLGVIYNPDNPVSFAEVSQAKRVCESVGIVLKEAAVREVDDIEQALKSIVNQGVDALWIPIERVVYQNMSKVASITHPAKLPVLSSTLEGMGFKEEGLVDEAAIAAVTVDYKGLGRLCVPAVIEILAKGKNPGDVPVQTMPYHQIVINTNAARDIGYQIPPVFLAKANRIVSGFYGKKIIVGGTGDSQDLLRTLARALEKNLGGGKIEVPESIGSSGGIKAVAEGEIDLARVARPLRKSEEKFGLTYRIFAKSPVVFVVHPSVTGIDDITTEQIIGIYTGNITDWGQLGAKAGKIYPITRETGDSCLRILNDNLSGFSNILTSAAKVIYSTPEAVATLEKHKKTIGYTTLTAICGTQLKVLKVDGIEPSVENVVSEKYKYAVPYAIVYRNEPGGLAKRFVDFLYSEEGRRIIIEKGAVPVK